MYKLLRKERIEAGNRAGTYINQLITSGDFKKTDLATLVYEKMGFGTITSAKGYISHACSNVLQPALRNSSEKKK